MNPLVFIALASTAVSFMGSLQTIKNYKAQAAWNKRKNDIDLAYKRISLNKKTARLLSEQRAAIGISGIAFTGSPLLVQNESLKSYENDLFWIEKGAVIRATEIDIKLAGLVTSELYNAGSSLLEGGMSYYSIKEDEKMAKALGKYNKEIN